MDKLVWGQRRGWVGLRAGKRTGWVALIAPRGPNRGIDAPADLDGSQRQKVYDIVSLIL